VTTTQNTDAAGNLLDRDLGDFGPEVAAAVSQELRRPFGLERFVTGALIDEHGAAAVAH
jgi:hypothetical protein